MTIRILMFQLPEDIACELRDAFISLRIVPAIEDRIPPGAVDWEQFDLVFCSAAPHALRQVLQAASAQLPRLRVIAASRLPDVREWLDSIEIGAADYCASPFEETQIRWLLETHATGGSRIAA